MPWKTVQIGQSFCYWCCPTIIMLFTVATLCQCCCRLLRLFFEIQSIAMSRLCNLVLIVACWLLFYLCGLGSGFVARCGDAMAIYSLLLLLLFWCCWYCNVSLLGSFGRLVHANENGDVDLWCCCCCTVVAMLLWCCCSCSCVAIIFALVVLRCAILCDCLV